jgi:hypothetical protein
VINSLLDQLAFAGCRFVKSSTKVAISAYQESIAHCFEIMSAPEARDKVKHALRDN